MSLVLSRVELRNFRNWREFFLEPDRKLTIIVGPNAIGKTSIVEAIQLLTQAASFRKPAWGETVHWGEPSASLKMVAEGDGRFVEVDLDISEAGKRVYKVNGKPRRTVSEVVGIVPCVVFSPDDLGLVKDSADKRRSALDLVGVQLSSSYARLKQEYEKTVRHRNVMLREGLHGRDDMKDWDERLISTGSRLTEYRKRLFSRLEAPVTSFYQGLARGESLQMRYETSWERAGITHQEDSATALRTLVDQKRTEEEARKVTLAGPHRDEIEFLIGGRSARQFASQGQQRTVALAWKLAEVSVITEVAGQPPVLLLDDVMSELDEARRGALGSLVGSAAQTFVTTTNLNYFDEGLVSRSKVVELG